MRKVFGNIRNWPLPLAMLGGVGLVISFLSPYFSTTTRWILVFVVLVFSLASPRAFRWLRTPTGVLIMIGSIWALLTYFWSMQPQLTLMKAGAWVLVVLALVAGAYHWVQYNSSRDALAFLFPLMIAVMLAGFLGQGDATSFEPSAGFQLYQGLTRGPNMFGSLLFMVMPLLLWKFHLSERHTLGRVVWSLLMASAVVMLLMSVARASIIGALLLFAVYFQAQPFSRRAHIGLLVGLVVTAALLTSADSLDYLEGRFIRKNLQQPDISPFYTREEPWKTSLHMAKAGGVFGAGYGVSIDGGHFRGGFTAVGYGREKGNTQLAIVEETGLVGLGLHLLFLAALFSMVWRAVRRVGDADHKVLLAIVAGALAGGFGVGLFEAWWVAPGAPESIWFWAMVGVGLGLCTRTRAAARLSTRPAVHMRGARRVAAV